MPKPAAELTDPAKVTETYREVVQRRASWENPSGDGRVFRVLQELKNLETVPDDSLTTAEDRREDEALELLGNAMTKANFSSTERAVMFGYYGIGEGFSDRSEIAAACGLREADVDDVVREYSDRLGKTGLFS